MRNASSVNNGSNVVIKSIAAGGHHSMVLTGNLISNI